MEQQTTRSTELIFYLVTDFTPAYKWRYNVSTNISLCLCAVCVINILVFFLFACKFLQSLHFIRKIFSVQNWKSFYLLTSCLYCRFHICIVNDSAVETVMIERSYNGVVYVSRVITLVQMYVTSYMDQLILFTHRKTNTLSL